MECCIAKFLGLKREGELIQSLKYVLDYSSFIRVQGANADFVLEKLLAFLADNLGKCPPFVNRSIGKHIECKQIHILAYLVLVALVPMNWRMVRSRC
jgi:hypothetical protein